MKTSYGAQAGEEKGVISYQAASRREFALSKQNQWGVDVTQSWKDTNIVVVVVVDVAGIVLIATVVVVAVVIVSSRRYTLNLLWRPKDKE